MRCFWSPKGGVGTTVVAALAAARLAQRHGEVLLVDLAGDLPALAGLSDAEFGVTDWLAVEGDADLAALRRIEMPMPSGVALLPTGLSTTWSTERSAALLDLLVADDRPVVVDAGCPYDGPGRPRTDLDELRVAVAERADESIVCLRPCYLGLRRALRADLRRTAIVVVGEAGRALDGRDIETVLGVPVTAQVELDPAVARAVDAGVFFDRPPRVAMRALRRVA